MPLSFPTTPRASLRVRLGAIAIGLAALLLAARTTLTSAGWVGRVFPGFMLLDNRVVASVGLAHWSGSLVSDLYQSEVVSMDGAAVGSTADVCGSPPCRPARPFATGSAATARNASSRSRRSASGRAT